MSGIQGQLLDVTVVACKQLKDTELFTRQDPYVCLEYASSRFRTRTCTDGGRNPSFQEKFQIPLIEGLRELNITVWNSNTLSRDDFIGTGRIQLYKVLSEGYDDSSWSLQTRNLKYAGEVNLVLHFSGASSSKKNENPSACTYALPPATTYGPPPSYTQPPPQPYAQPPLQPYAQPPPISLYPPVGGYPYSAPPSAPPAYSGACYPPPPVMNQYRPAAYPPAPYQPYGPSYQPTPTAQSPYYPTPGPYSGVYPPSN